MRFITFCGFLSGVLATVWAAAAFSLPAPPQGAAPGGATPDPPAEQVFKNIQVLKGMPASQLRPVMGLISTSLGVRCGQCHVQGAFDKDDKEAKRTARRMIRMVIDVNQGNFEGETRVTCFTCHRGQEQPVAVPPVGEEVAAPSGERLASADLPTFDQIVEKYVQAVGGSAAFDNLRSRVMKGTVTEGRGGTGEIEIDQSAPDRIVTITRFQNREVSQGYNGSVAWAKSPFGQSEIVGAELAQIRRAADIARPLKIREECQTPRVLGKSDIGGKEAFEVAGRTDGQRVRLFLDSGTGLLLRRRVLVDTVLGAFPEQDDYSDYRKVDGIYLPFVIRHATAEAAADSTIRLTEITHNTPVDASRFDPPAVQK
jgi:hypothetical protein